MYSKIYFLHDITPAQVLCFLNSCKVLYDSHSFKTWPFLRAIGLDSPWYNKVIEVSESPRNCRNRKSEL